MKVKSRTISWNQFEKDIAILAWKISQNEIRIRGSYTGIYGIKRGGLVVAVRLSHLLGLPLLNKPGRGCLVVDDVSDTGKTLGNSSWQGMRLSHVTATLYRKDGTKTEPTFYVRTINAWIKFPWEKGGRNDLA